jgi:tetratricopeptide (TPR) repeat protein
MCRASRAVKILALPILSLMLVVPSVRADDRGVTYLVAPLQNRSASAGLSWMSAALSQTLAEKLEAHPSLRPAYGEKVLLPVYKEAGEDARAVRRAQELGVRWLFAGHFDRASWRYAVGLRLYDVPSGNLIVEAEARAPAPSGSAVVMELLDQALLDLLQRAGHPAGEAAPAITRRPTRDGYAMTLYGRALLAYYQAHVQDDEPTPGELARVELLLNRACFIDPRFAEAHRMLGLVLLEQGETAKALGQYAYALDLRPDYFAAIAGLGRLHRQAGSTGNRARAMELMELALKVRPFDLDSRLALGELLWEAERLPEAQAELLKVVAERPDHLPARRTLALVYAARGLSEQLAAELLRILALQPDDIEARMDLAAAYQRMGRLRQAIAVYEEVVRRRPRHAETYRQVGDLYRRVREPARAAAAYQRLLKLSSDDPRPYFLLSAAYVEMGQEAKAEQVLQDAQQFRRYLGESWTNLGVLALRRNELQRAAWYLQRAASRERARPRAHYNYALVLDRMNQPERALSALKAAAELDPGDAEVRYATGVVLAKLGRTDEASRAFAEALQLGPETSPMTRIVHADARHNLALLSP